MDFTSSDSTSRATSCAALAAIAQAGKGRYFNAQTVAELNKAIDGLGRDLEIQSKPAETASKIVVGKARLVKNLASKIELPPMDRVFVTPVGTDRMVLWVQNVGRATAYGQTIPTAPSEKAECFSCSGGRPSRADRSR